MSSRHRQDLNTGSEWSVGWRGKLLILGRDQSLACLRLPDRVARLFRSPESEVLAEGVFFFFPLLVSCPWNPRDCEGSRWRM